MGAPVQPSFTQTSFQFRNDDGGEISATEKENPNTNTTEKPYKIFRCRFSISQTVSNANQNLTRAYKLRYALNNGTYIDVGAQGSATIIRYANSSNITDNEATSNILLISQNTFVSGRVDENGDTGTITFISGALSFTEVEFVLELYGGAINQTDNLDLRVFETNNTLLAAYTNTARIKRRRRLRVLG
jgi:hypothetical protein